MLLSFNLELKKDFLPHIVFMFIFIYRYITYHPYWHNFPVLSATHKSVFAF